MSAYQSYYTLVVGYLREPSGEVLLEATELGRRLAADSNGPELVVELQYEAMQRLKESHAEYDSETVFRALSVVQAKVLNALGEAARHQFAKQVRQELSHVASINEALESTETGSILLNAIHQVVWSNGPARRLCGLAEKGSQYVLGSEICDANRELLDELMGLLERRRPAMIEREVSIPSRAQTLMYRFEYRPLDAGPRRGGASLTVTDITWLKDAKFYQEQERIEVAVRERLHEVLESIPCDVLVVDPQGQIQMGSALQNQGISVGDSLYQAFEPLERVVIRRALWRAMRGETVRVRVKVQAEYTSRKMAHQEVRLSALTVGSDQQRFVSVAILDGGGTGRTKDQNDEKSSSGVSFYERVM